MLALERPEVSGLSVTRTDAMIVNAIPNKSTPPQAETDLHFGCARIPANWPLQLVILIASCLNRSLLFSVCFPPALSSPLQPMPQTNRGGRQPREIRDPVSNVHPRRP